MAEQAALGFAGLLRQLRDEAGLTQEELAARAGLSPRTVSDLERGTTRTAHKDTAELLADALGLAEPVSGLFVAAARGRAPAAQVLAALRGDAWPGCPYLGLAPFQERDARVFFGRSDLVAQLVQRLAERRDSPGILLVAGESGAGKSSLLRAGLMPALAEGALGPGSQRWPRRVIRPAGSPLRELAMQLAHVAGIDPVSAYLSLKAAPGEAPMLAEQAVRTAAGRVAGPGTGPGAPDDAAAAAPPRLVLVIDQLEELFTAGEDSDAGRAEREAFISALHAAATVPASPPGLPPALVVAAVRADFLGRLIAYPPLKAALDAGPFTVGPMSDADLRLAITGPAVEASLTVEPALVQAVIAELREGTGGVLGSGVLPLLSQAMAATWKRREGSELTLSGYKNAGGVAKAVNNSAQDAYDALTSQQKDAAHLVFTRLTIITADGQFARRRCNRADLHAPGSPMTADVDAVIDIFSAQRLLVLGRDSVEISHDALLQAWTQLRDWLADNQHDRALYSQIITDADAWASNHKDPAYLYRPGRLATIDAATSRWQDAPARYPLDATIQAFLGASTRAKRRATRWRRGLTAGLLALTLAAATAAGVAVHDAGIAAGDAAIALSRQLAADSQATHSTNPVTARQLAVAAWRVSPTSQAYAAMQAGLIEQQEDGMLPVTSPGQSSSGAVAFSPDGKQLATFAHSTVRLWNPATGQPAGAPIQTGSGVLGMAFSPDGKQLATANADGTARLWNLATGQPADAPIPGGGRYLVLGVAFSPDGMLLATANGAVRLWNPATGQPAGAPIQISDGGALVVAFSPDGKQLATANADGTARLWNPASGQPAGAPIQTGSGVVGVAFSPDGKLLATADDQDNGTARLWNLATGQPADAPIQTGSDGVLGVAFSPDGKQLATADDDGTARLWNLATGQPVMLMLEGSVSAADGVAFSPDGKQLATAGYDGTVRLWNPATIKPVGRPIQPSDFVQAVAFSPDGKLATGGVDGTVRFWDLATGQPAGHPIQTGSSNGLEGVEFSPNGMLLATTADGAVRLWNPATGQPAGHPIQTGFQIGVLRVAFSRDGKLLATIGSNDNTVRLWNPATGQPAGRPTQPSDGVQAVAFSPDGKLATGGVDGTVRFWDPATGQPVGAPIQTADQNGPKAVAFSPDGNLLVTVGAEVQLWDPATGQPVGAPIQTGLQEDSVTAVTFSPDGGQLVVVYVDQSSLVYVSNVWNLSLFANPYAVLCADVGPLTRQAWDQYAPGEPQPKVCS